MSRGDALAGREERGLEGGLGEGEGGKRGWRRERGSEIVRE